MSALKTVIVFNEATGKWSELRTAPNADGTLNMDRVREQWKARRSARSYEEDGEDFELTAIAIPEGVQYIVPVVSNEELAEIKRRRREKRLKRELEIKMKY